MKPKNKIQARNFFVNGFADSWNYVGENKVYVLLIVTIFLYLFLAGLFLPTPAAMSEKINAAIKEIVAKTANLGQLQLIIFIFKNNITVSLIGIFLGILFGLAPITLSISNGYILGYVCKKVIAADGTGTLWKLLPHGIFELPAVMISLGVGLRLGVSVFYSLNQNSLGEFWKNFVSAIKVLIFIVVPLLFVAAIIEGSLIKLLA